MTVLCLYCVCVMSETKLPCEQIKNILLVTLAKSIFLFFVPSWYNEGAPWPRHGSKSAHFHCYQQGGPLHALHCGAHRKAVGALTETTRLQQSPHGHRQQRRCCRSRAAVRPVTQVWLLYSTRTSLKRFKIHVSWSRLCLPWQHHTYFHPVKCVWREPWPPKGLLQRPPSSQQQQKAGGAHAAADRVSGWSG